MNSEYRIYDVYFAAPVPLYLKIIMYGLFI